MTSLEMLLVIPDGVYVERKWKELTTGDKLLRALQEAIKADSLGNARERVKEWQDYAEYKGAEAIRRWHVLRALVFAAEFAALNPSTAGRLPELIREFGEGSQVPDPLPVHPASLETSEWRQFLRKQLAGLAWPAPGGAAWAWTCLRELWGDPVANSVQIAVAGWDSKRGEEGGFLASLVLEVLGAGTGMVAHHPIDAFETHVDASFAQAIRDAWAMATNGESTSFDGRWRLFEEPERRGGEAAIVRSAAEANERSASGAAARGWWFALNNKKPDEGVIVVAEVDEKDKKRLKGVLGVPAKVKAIAEDHRLDTIVVASEKNEKEARETPISAYGAHVEQQKPDERKPSQEKPGEQKPWHETCIRLDDGRMIKIVNLDASDD